MPQGIKVNTDGTAVIRFTPAEIKALEDWIANGSPELRQGSKAENAVRKVQHAAYRSIRITGKAR